MVCQLERRATIEHKTGREEATKMNTKALCTHIKDPEEPQQCHDKESKMETQVEI